MGVSQTHRLHPKLVSCRLAALYAIAALAGCWPETTTHPVNQSQTGAASCYPCHRAEYESVQDPVHVGNFPTTCEGCHASDSWLPALSGPHPEQRFHILSGVHRGLECGTCHQAELGPNGASNTNCVGCHLGTHQRGKMNARHARVPGYSPDAVGGNFCLSCHPAGEAFDGAAHPEDRFPIRTQGAHVGLVCGDCHDRNLGDKNGADNSNCVGCHLGAHQRQVIDPLHSGVAGYPQGDAGPNFCLGCHPSGSVESVEHPNDRFPLQAQHGGFACSDCHNDSLGITGAGNTDCVGCHLGAHARGAIDPRHAGVAGYPAGDAAPNFCLACHPSGSAQSLQHPNARFPLQAQHGGFGCSDCHKAALGPNGAGNTDCVGCHLGAHARGAIDPRHSGVVGYPAGDAGPNFCLGCHPSGTADSQQHPNDRFPLQAQHGGFGCSDCHDASLGVNGAGNANCVGCHLGAHERSVIDVRHVGVTGYPSGAANPNFCLGCHAQGSALLLRHPDNLFPLSGPHGRYACADCHDESAGPNGLDNTDCIGCHVGAHDFNRMQAEHRGVNGFPASPPNRNFCLECHPQGRE